MKQFTVAVWKGQCFLNYCFDWLLNRFADLRKCWLYLFSVYFIQKDWNVLCCRPNCFGIRTFVVFFLVPFTLVTSFSALSFYFFTSLKVISIDSLSLPSFEIIFYPFQVSIVCNSVPFGLFASLSVQLLLDRELMSELYVCLHLFVFIRFHLFISLENFVSVYRF